MESHTHAHTPHETEPTLWIDQPLQQLKSASIGHSLPVVKQKGRKGEVRRGEGRKGDRKGSGGGRGKEQGWKGREVKGREMILQELLVLHLNTGRAM